MLCNMCVGEKKAKTKGRLINESINSAVLDEKFQINSVFELNSDGKPKTEKLVYLV